MIQFAFRQPCSSFWTHLIFVFWFRTFYKSSETFLSIPRFLGILIESYLYKQPDSAGLNSQSFWCFKVLVGNYTTFLSLAGETVTVYPSATGNVSVWASPISPKCCLWVMCALHSQTAGSVKRALFKYGSPLNSGRFSGQTDEGLHINDYHGNI